MSQGLGKLETGAAAVAAAVVAVVAVVAVAVAARIACRGFVAVAAVAALPAAAVDYTRLPVIILHSWADGHSRRFLGLMSHQMTDAKPRLRSR